MPEEQKKYIKKSTSVNVCISDLKNNRGRVSIIGTIVSKNSDQYTFVLEDAGDRILVITNDIDRFDSLKEGQVVRVFGKTIGEGDDLEVLSEIIQDFSKFNLELWKKVQTMK